MNKSGSLACHVNHSNDGINFFSADTNIAGICHWLNRYIIESRFLPSSLLVAKIYNTVVSVSVLGESLPAIVAAVENDLCIKQNK
jgi:hypothetical protein